MTKTTKELLQEQQALAELLAQKAFDAWKQDKRKWRSTQYAEQDGIEEAFYCLIGGEYVSVHGIWDGTTGNHRVIRVSMPAIREHWRELSK